MLLSDIRDGTKYSILGVLGPGMYELKADPEEQPGEGSMLFSSEEFGAQSWAFDLEWGTLTDFNIRQWLERAIRSAQGDVTELVGYSASKLAGYSASDARFLYWGDNPEKMLKAFPDKDFRASTLCDKTFLVN